MPSVSDVKWSDGTMSFRHIMVTYGNKDVRTTWYSAVLGFARRTALPLRSKLAFGVGWGFEIDLLVFPVQIGVVLIKGTKDEREDFGPARISSLIPQDIGQLLDLGGCTDRRRFVR